MTHDARLWFPLVRAVLRRPALWWTASHQLARMARPRWWRRPPFLPLPDAGYVRYRIETAYGRRGVPVAADVISYLTWCRAGERARPRPARRPTAGR